MSASGMKTLAAMIRKQRPKGTRPGGVVKPERNPVRPKVPGTRDQMRPPQATTDPKVKKRAMRDV